jgi:hypothetical protein
MENFAKNIELINSYLNKTLSEAEVKDFENRLENEKYFKDTYENHIDLLEGLKRQTLKLQIKKGKQTYIRNKWFRYLGILIAVLIASISIYFTLKSSNVIKKDVLPEEINNANIVSDTISYKSVLQEEIYKKDTLKTQVQAQSVVNVVLNNKELIEVKFPKKIPQTFSLDALKETTITCKEGTKLVIKASSFLYQNDKIVTGKIDFKVTEYYKVSDMLLANLTTKSDGEQLETGGMLFIEATKDNLDLKLKENSAIEIYFPVANKKEGMQLFTGTWNSGTVNWKLQKELIEKTVKEVEEDIEVPYAVIEQVPVYPGCENLTNAQAKKCTSEAISKFAQTNFNTEIAKNLGLTGRQRVNVIFKINSNGEVVDVRSRASDPDLEEEANRVFTSLPKMQPGKQRGRAVTVPYSLPIIFQIDVETPLIANFSGDNRERKRMLDSINNKRFEDRLTGTERVNITASEVSRYMLRTLNLGWINCDRFNRSGQRIKYKLKISNDTGVKVDMVFKSINSVLPSFRTGSDFDFDMVPKNEVVILVAVKKVNEKLYLDLVETTTKENPNVEFNFKEVTLSELKAQLKKLDNLFN